MNLSGRMLLIVKAVGRLVWLAMPGCPYVLRGEWVMLSGVAVCTTGA